MITIKMLAAWFCLSASIFGLFGYFMSQRMNEDRGFNTHLVLVSQGLAAAILAFLT